MRNALIIFVRNPVLGKVKTRLAATLGNENALEIYKQLLQHTHDITQSLPYQKFIFFADYINENDLWENDSYVKQLQHGDDLGSRMANAFSQLFDDGYQQICIIGSDCIELTGYILRAAFEQLQHHDAVIGPSLDGGYYLLGMSQPILGIFENKNWSTNEVLPATLKSIHNKNLSLFLLPQLSDIDTAEDWQQYQSNLKSN